MDEGWPELELLDGKDFVCVERARLRELAERAVHHPDDLRQLREELKKLAEEP